MRLCEKPNYHNNEIVIYLIYNLQGIDYEKMFLGDIIILIITSIFKNMIGFFL